MDPRDSVIYSVWKTKWRTMQSVTKVVNLVYRCHNAKYYYLLKFEIAHEDTWIEYEISQLITHEEIAEKIRVVMDFHKSFYEVEA